MKKLLSQTKSVKAQSTKTNQVARSLYTEIRSLIESTRGQVSQAVNSGLVTMYWQIGTMIRKNVLGEERAEYGKQILYALSRKLILEYGEGFSERNLAYMVRFAETFPHKDILHTVCAKLSWSHIRRIVYLDDDLKRTFYVEMCRLERWSVRVLEEKISGLLYERTAISKKPAKLIKQELQSLRREDALTPDLVFRDPYLLDFLGLFRRNGLGRRRVCRLGGGRFLDVGHGRMMTFRHIHVRRRARAAIKKFVAAANRKIDVAPIELEIDRTTRMRQIPDSQRALRVRRGSHCRHVLNFSRAIADVTEFDQGRFAVDGAGNRVRLHIPDPHVEQSRDAVDDVIIGRKIAALCHDRFAARPHASRSHQRFVQID